MCRAAIFASGWALLLIGLPLVQAHDDDEPSAVTNRAFTPIQDSATNYNLEILPDYMGGDEWPTAILILQEIFDAGEDAFVSVARPGPDGKEVVVWTGARAEALRILAKLPAAGRAAYELTANPRGRELLKTARNKGDWQLVADVARRFPLTPAGLEAAKLLGTHHLDRGDAGQAARWFRLWQQRNAQWEADGLGACLAWAALLRSGQPAEAGVVWQKLQAKHADGLVLGQRKVSLGELKQLWQSAKPGAPHPGLAWSTFAGNAARTGVAGKLPTVDALHWSVATSRNPTTSALVEEAIRRQEDRPQPVMPGCFPIALGDKIICRTQAGIQALAPTTGKVIWDRPFDRSLDRLLTGADSRLVVQYWLDSYLRYHPQVLLENTNLGCLTADAARVYAVDNLPVLPFFSRYVGKKGKGGMTALPPYDLAVADAVQRSQLRALDVTTGEVAWEIGGRPEGDPFLDHCYFLGPPLSVQGKLYGMAEKSGYLYLFCLEPSSPKLLWKQCLGAPYYVLAHDGGRRLQALHVSYDQGVLVCPTNAGAVLAYDLHTSSLLWAHAYRTKTVSNFPKLKRLRPARELEIESLPNLRNQLQVTAPVICQGKVVIAGPDTPVVECLRLTDGTPLWQVERTSDDLFLAGVYRDKVLLVGRKACRALSLTDGKELWQTEVGEPAGRGVFLSAGDGYLLPVKTDANAKSARVMFLHLESGKAKHWAELPDQQAAGNLLVVDDRLIGQSVTAIAGWGPKNDKVTR